MKTVLKLLRLATFVAVLSSRVWASVSLELLSSGNSTVSVFPGESFTVDIVVRSNAGDSINVVGLLVEMSVGGIRYDSYNWQAPFDQQPLLSDRFTAPKSTDLPVLITADSFDDTDEFDFYLYNVSEEEAIVQEEGYVIVSCDFTIPAGFDQYGTYSMTIDKDDPDLIFDDEAFNHHRGDCSGPFGINYKTNPSRIPKLA